MKYNCASRNISYSILLLLTLLILLGAIQGGARSILETYHASGYIVNGTDLSGDVPVSVQGVDSDYFIVGSSGTTISTTGYNPSAFNFPGSTEYVYGSVADLQSNKGVYMPFNSYVSAFSTTSFSEATVGYRSNTCVNLLSSPKIRSWNGTVWDSGETELVSAGSPVQLVRVAYSPVAQYYNYCIVVALSNDGILDAYVYNGTAWAVWSNLADLWTTAPFRSQRPFDIAFSTTSGDALLVYAWYDDTANDLAYRRWFANNQSWSAEVFLDDTTQVAEADYSFVVLSTDPTPNSNYIGVIALDLTNMDVVAWTWSGAAFGNQTQLTDTVSTFTREDLGIAFDYAGKLMIVAGEGANEVIIWNQWTKTGGWGTSRATSDIDPAEANVPRYVTLKADPSSDDLMLTLLDWGNNVHSLYWSGASWTFYANQDTAVDERDMRCVDFEWEPTEGKGIQVRGTTAGEITWRTWTTGVGWGADNNQTMGANVHPWVQLRRNPRNVAGDVKILGAVLEDTVFDLGAIKWDGTTFTVIGSSTFTDDITVNTYESFDLEFQMFGNPEFTSEVEFDWVTTLLYILPVVFVLLFLLALKRKRGKKTKPYVEKKADAFSEQFGITHQQIIGKKMLLEIDPTSDYQRALSSFVSEAKNNDELLFVLTNQNSAIHSAFSGAPNVFFLLQTSEVPSSEQINEKETLLPASDLSVLLDSCVRIQKVETEKTINLLFDNLSDIILRFGFEKTYKFIRLLLQAIPSPKTTALFVSIPTAHDQTITSSIRGLFQNQLAYTKNGPKVVIL